MTNKPEDQQKALSLHPRAGRSIPLIAIALISTAILLVGDFGLKYWSFNNLADEPINVADVIAQKQLLPAPGEAEWELIPSVLQLELVINQGAVFGIGQGKRWIFIIITVIALGVISVIFACSSRKAHFLHLALILILAGAIGNLYDRAIYGGVRDMLHMFPGVSLPFGWHWPGNARNTGLYPWVFNLADVYLVIGISITMIRMIFTKEPDPAKATAAEEAEPSK